MIERAGVAEPKPRIAWGPILAAWTLYWLLNAAQVRITSSYSRAAPMPWSTALLLQYPLAALWALLTPGILWMGRRFPLDRRHWPLSVPVHVIASVAIVFGLDVLYAWHTSHIMNYPVERPVLLRALQLFEVWFIADGLLYWLVLSLGYTIEHQRRLRERDLAASELQTQLAQADLQALKMQLHPHFLFNALHTIGSLVRTGDRDTAVRVVAGLGDLLRRMLDDGSQQEVPLRQEIDFIRNYLAIEQVRFRDRLHVAINVDDAALDARVPHLILQPLVENAIRHGIGPHANAGRLTVAARRSGGDLHLLVRDDGPGIGDGNGTRPGIGLANTRARLTRLYGKHFTLEVCNAVDGGLEARIELPFRPAAADWSGTR